MEVLSEHQCQGWLEGYLLTERHGFFSCYEAFVHIVDSMFNQHAKWLKVCRHISMAQADRLAQLFAQLTRLAAGPQRFQPSRPWISLGARAAYAQQAIREKLLDHRSYITERGDDLPEIRNWQWGGADRSKTANADTAADNV